MTTFAPGGALKGLLLGAAAGAAGATALNAVTYFDMAVRGRGASGTPAKTVEALASAVGAGIPGRGETRDNRVSALGALSGIGTGVAIGAFAGAVHGLGLPDISTVFAGPVLGAVAMAATDTSMTALGVTEPGTWSAVDWLSDAIPHLAYGVVTAATLHALRPQAAQESR